MVKRMPGAMIGSLLPGLLLCMTAAAASDEPQPQRVRHGLVALYDFSEADGTAIRDRSGVEPSVDLVIERPDSVRWLGTGLQVEASAVILSAEPAERIIDAIKRSQGLTSKPG